MNNKQYSSNNNNNSSMNILHLLHRRERYGIQNDNTVRFSNISSNRRVHCRDLSIASAWNPKRLQNMILAVGPTTPAFILDTLQKSMEGNASSSNSSSSSSNSSSGHSSSSGNRGSSSSSSSSNGDGSPSGGQTMNDWHQNTNVGTAAEEEIRQEHVDAPTMEVDDDVMEMENVHESTPESLSGQKRCSNQSYSDEESSFPEEHDGADRSLHGTTAAGAGDGVPPSTSSPSPCPSQMQSQSPSASPPIKRHTISFPSQYVPSMSHSGCVNTASWIDCPWRFSTAKSMDVCPMLNSFIISSSHSSNSNTVQNIQYDASGASSVRPISCSDCPTQIVTSGDDRIVKFWDCSQSMGSVSPVPSPATLCPLAHQVNPSDYSNRAFKFRQRSDDTVFPPGLVQSLGSMRTGHRGNVFHTLPLAYKPGHIMTCAADGKLNICDVARDSVSTILSLDGMLFSHIMLDENIGLACGEDGLMRFDLRMPRASQPTRSFLSPSEGCRSCAIYSASEAETSAYVFAGGTNEVHLYDLRFLSDSCKSIHKFRPSCFPANESVSISGIDISKDRKELLVSYESDQIYTFPIFPSHISDPTTDDMISYSENNRIESPHFSSYGAHLNRFTFLKSAKYAGPNDEYICTGSDSGHAFIYEKKTGSVVSMLKADKSTCNGVVPHPTLPFFITYGIESNAKLWRATNPVDDTDDDTTSGRRRAYHEQQYQKSMLVSRCSDIQSYLNKAVSDTDLKKMEPTLLPDEVSLRSVNMEGHFFAGLPEILFRSLFHENPFNPGADIICNDLQSVPEVLRSNYYEAINSVVDGDEVPVRCGMDELHRRISLVRLLHQAHQLDIHIDPDRPWNMESIFPLEGRDENSLSRSDLIPNSPADWLPYDKTFSSSALDGGRALNYENCEDFYFTRYCISSSHRNDENSEPSDKSSREMQESSVFNASKAWDILLDTITSIKEEGNRSLQKGSVHRAAHLYDKALAYCAVAFLNYPQTNLDFVTDHQKLLAKNAGHCIRWSPLLKAYVSIRLNLSMTLLKPEIIDTEAAHSQAFQALQDLRPFTKKAGTVLTGKRLQKIRHDEPIQTFQEAKELEAKAYFRLGSVKLQGRQYTAAMHMFEKCLAATKECRPNDAPDKVIQHRLAEAKRLCEKERKKRRKQFRFAFGHDVDDHDSSRDEDHDETNL